MWRRAAGGVVPATPGPLGGAPRATVAAGAGAANQRTRRARRCDPRYTDQVLSSSAKQILEAALKLPPEEREEIVDELAASLTREFSSKEIEGAWLGEINRRSDEIDAGTAEILEWSDVREQIAQRRARRTGQ